MRRCSVLILTFIFVTSCNNSSYIPFDVLKPDQMQSLFWDIIRGDILAQEIVRNDSTKNIKTESFIVAQKVFSIHHMNQEKFKKSIAFYAKHPTLMKTIFDSLAAVQARKEFIGIEKRRPVKIYPHSRPNMIKAQ